VFNHTTQADTVNHLSHNVTNTQRLFTAGSDTVAFLAGHLALWMSEKAGRVVDDVRVVAVLMLKHLVRKRHTLDLVPAVVFCLIMLHYCQRLCDCSLRLFVHCCAKAITLNLFVKIRLFPTTFYFFIRVADAAVHHLDL